MRNFTSSVDKCQAFIIAEKTSASSADSFHAHRRIMHGDSGFYYFNGQSTGWAARQVTQSGDDVAPAWVDDVYFNVYPLGRPPQGRGRAQDVIGAGGLFAEFDAKDYGDLGTVEAFNAAKRAAWDAIAALRVQPSAIVDSGGGYHCYWYFSEFLPFDRDGAHDTFAAALAAWVALVGGDPGAKDLARVLRVPGTFNGKEKYFELFGAPLPVTFVEFHPDRRYAVAELVAMLPEGWDAETRRTTKQRARRWAGGRAVPVWKSDLPDTPEVRRYNATHKIAEVLQAAGYRQSSTNPKRWIAPQSESGESSVQVSERHNNCWHYSAKNAIGRTGAAAPADFLLMSETFNGDVAACMAFLRGEKSGIDWERLYTFAKWGDITPFVKARQAEIAEQAQAKATAAAQLFADNPNDQTEAAALAAQRYAEKAAKAAAAIGHPTEVTDRAIMTAILDKLRHAFEKYGVDAARMSISGLSAQANRGRPTVMRTLDRLTGWFVEVSKAGTRAPLVRLARPVMQVASMIQDGTDRTACTILDHRCNLAPWEALYAHDAFSLAMTPRPDTPEERAKVARTVKGIRDGTNVQPREGEEIKEGVTFTEGVELETSPLPDDSWRARLAAGYIFTQARRFHASRPSFGGRALLLLDHLHALGGEATGKALCERMGLKKDRISKLLRTLIDGGLVEKVDNNTFAMVAAWRDVVEEIVVEMPTYGSSAMRQAHHLDVSLLYQGQRLVAAIDSIQAAQNDAERERAELRANAIVNTIETREAQRAELESWATAERAAGHLPACVLRQILKRGDTQENTEQAAWRARAAQSGRRHYDRIKACRYLASGKYKGLSDSDLAFALQADGFTRHTIAEAMGRQ